MSAAGQGRGFSLGMDTVVPEAGQGCSPCAGPKATGRNFHLGNYSLCSWCTFSSFCSTTGFYKWDNPLRFHMSWVKPTPFGSALVPSDPRLCRNRFCWCWGRGAGHRCLHHPQPCPGSGLSAFPLSQPSTAVGSTAEFCHECYLIYWEEEMWILPQQKMALGGVEGCNQSFTLSVPLPMAPEYKELSWWGFTSGTHLLSVSSPTWSIYTTTNTMNIFYIF